MRVDAFEAAIERSSEVNRCVMRYLNVLFSQLVLSASCNRLHSLEQRCARWLLGCRDRTQFEEVPVTPECGPCTGRTRDETDDRVPPRVRQNSRCRQLTFSRVRMLSPCEGAPG
jgi:CRP-like cAMP-binding protein